jgi:diaminohydroxyphosphoribosylaminopyrimidine deaminase/5-amino-6-(5-phosphoribosylamino)uracil reductase
VPDVDERYMTRALELAALGEPSPNPKVGAVVVKDGAILGEGCHKEAGGPHAETEALGLAGAGAQGATLYSTLEPCCHEGRTPPCTDAIVRAGIRRVVFGSTDPNPSVPGHGKEVLLAAGLEVSGGVLETECDALIRPWRTFITQGRSHLSLKLAVSLDGRIASRTGDAKWISGEESRKRAHALRAANDAVMVGIGTVLADDPSLTVRLVSGSNPIRVVVDSQLRIPLSSEIVTTCNAVPTCVVTTPEASSAAESKLTELGVAVVRVPATAEGRCDMKHVLEALAKREVVSVLCEGGAELAGSLLAGRLPKDIHMFVAPMFLGPRGKPMAVAWAGPEGPDNAPHVDSPTWEQCGNDAYISGTLVYPKKVKATP